MKKKPEIGAEDPKQSFCGVANIQICQELSGVPLLNPVIFNCFFFNKANFLVLRWWVENVEAKIWKSTRQKSSPSL